MPELFTLTYEWIPYLRSLKKRIPPMLWLVPSDIVRGIRFVNLSTPGAARFAERAEPTAQV